MVGLPFETPRVGDDDALTSFTSSVSWTSGVAGAGESTAEAGSEESGVSPGDHSSRSGKARASQFDGPTKSLNHCEKNHYQYDPCAQALGHGTAYLCEELRGRFGMALLRLVINVSETESGHVTVRPRMNFVNCTLSVGIFRHTIQGCPAMTMGSKRGHRHHLRQPQRGELRNSL